MQMTRLRGSMEVLQSPHHRHMFSSGHLAPSLEMRVPTASRAGMPATSLIPAKAGCVVTTEWNKNN